METNKNTKTIYLDFSYEEDTIEEALDNFRKEFPYAIVNEHVARTEYQWPEIECIVPEGMALEFLTMYHGGDIDQAMEFMED